MMPHDVTQADREAAASLSDAVFCHPDIVAEAFAAHRIAAIAEERARVVEFVESKGCEQRWQRCCDLADAIERGDHIQEK